MVPDVVALHIEPTNICTLKCPACERTQFLKQWPQHWKNFSIDIDHLMTFLDIDLQGKLVNLCGNTGDPIYHPEFHRLLSRLKQQGCKLAITTNGSYKTQDWWQETVNLLDEQDTVFFSVDGSPENFTQYRINADWHSIQAAMKICVDSKCKTVWKYIPFSFNEHSVNEAQQISESMGIDRFWVIPSDRFDNKTADLKPKNYQVDVKYQAKQAWTNNNINLGVVPKCQDGSQHYISAAGFYSACCYVSDHRFYYKTEFGKNKKFYAIADHTLTQILTRPAVMDFYDHLTTKSVCQYNCPAT